MKNRKSISVAAYIKTQISVCGVAQKDIAAALGYENPNVVSMIKNGKTRLPLTKVAPLAKILEVDPIHLLRLTMTEYCPETWQVFQHLIGRSLITANELALLEVVRKVCGDLDLALKDKAERDALAAIVQDIAFNQHKPGFGR